MQDELAALEGAVEVLAGLQALAAVARRASVAKRSAPERRRLASYIARSA